MTHEEAREFLAEPVLTRAILHSIADTTPGGISRERIMRRGIAPIMVAIAWLPVFVAVALAVLKVITR